MADHYVKLWASIVDSSIWKEPERHRIVWVTMLTMADRNGFVGASIDGLARRANVPEEDVEKALASFLAPDPRSRNQENEGRRIQVVPRGWHILNHGYFRDLQDKAELRAYEAERKREQRAKGAAMSRTVPDTSQNVQAPSSDADAASVAVSKRESTRGREPVAKPYDVTAETWADWCAFRKSKKAPVTERVIADTRKKAAAVGMTMEAALIHWMSQGYTGFFPPSKDGSGGQRRPALATLVGDHSDHGKPTKNGWTID